MKRILFGLVALSALVVLFWYVNGEPEEKTGRALAQVTVPKLSAADREGETAFNEKCVACHGANAAGKDGFGPPLVHKIYEPSHHGDMSFVLAAKKGVRAHHWRFGDMPPVQGVTELEVQLIIAYVRALQRANGIR